MRVALALCIAAPTPPQVAELRRQGVRYAFVNGTTGEGATMSVDERKAALEAWIAAAAADGGELTIIAHVGAEAIADTLALAAHAKAAGAAALATLTPTFNKPASIDLIVDLLDAVGAAAPGLPLYYYHIAIKTGVAIRCDVLLERVHAARASGSRPGLAAFRGLKYSDTNQHILANCVAFAGGAYDVLSGADEMLLGALAMGCTGAVGSTYNYQGREANAIIAAFRGGRMAEALALQRVTQAGVDLLLTPERFGGAGVNVGKALMELRLSGKHTGPPRFPGRPMPEEGKAALRAAAEAAGFFGGLQAAP